MSTRKKRSPKGEPSINVSNGILQIRLPLPDKSIQYLSTGLRDTPENRVLVDERLAVLRRDIYAGTFQIDGWKQRYHPKPKVSQPSFTHDSAEITIKSIWIRYRDHCEKIFSFSTVASKLRVADKFLLPLLEKPEFQSLSSAKQLISYIYEIKKESRARALSETLRAMFNFALDSGWMNENPIAGMKLRGSKAGNQADPFTKREIDLILNEFRVRGKTQYALFAEFLYRTGCRPSEAVALKKSDITEKYILFQSADVKGREKQGLKTQKNRRFPINKSLQKLIDEILKTCSDDCPYLLQLHGDKWKYDTFYTEWGRNDGEESRGVVWHLAKTGQITHYRSPYSLRDTLISTYLKDGISHKQVAKWVGNSEITIVRHYSGLMEEEEAPDL